MMSHFSKPYIEFMRCCEHLMTQTRDTLTNDELVILKGYLRKNSLRDFSANRMGAASEEALGFEDSASMLMLVSAMFLLPVLLVALYLYVHGVFKK
jgi:hypothetical protein